jgi:hypothetical protein
MPKARASKPIGALGKISPAILFPWAGYLPLLSMQKPDRIGAIVLAFTLFAAYWGWAGLLYFLGSISLPLGSLGSYGLILVLVDVIIVNLYTLRQRRRARTSRNPVSKTH